MPFPVTLATRQIHVDVRDATGNAAAGSVTFTNQFWLFDETGNVVLAPGSYTAALVNGEATVEVPATDAAGVTPTSRTVTVQIRVGAVRTSYAIEVPSGVGTLELADLPPVATPPAVVTYATAAQLAATNAEVDDLGQTVQSTGITWGFEMSANAAPATINIAAGVGYIVDETVPSAPVVTRVEEDDRTAVLDAAGQARVLTWWLMDEAGALTQQAAVPTPQQRREFIILGRTAYNPLTGVFLGFKHIHTMLRQQANLLVDLMDALGPFSLSGNRITPVSGTLSFDKTAGFVYLRGAAHDIEPGNPNEGSTPAQTPAQFRRLTQTTATVTPLFTTLDVGNYDVGGVVTPIGGGAGSSTIQRVWLTPSDNTQDQISVQYGQTVHSSLTAALDGIGVGTYTPNPGLPDLAALIGYIVVTKTATDLSDTAQARFVNAAKFAIP